MSLQTVDSTPRNRHGKKRRMTNAEFQWLLRPENRCVNSVYVLCADDHAVKIGVSRDPGKRAKQIQSGQDRKICIYWAVELWRPQAIELERRLHERLRKQTTHIRGEWYLLSPAQAVAEIKREISRCCFQSDPHPLYGMDTTPQQIPIPRRWYT